MKITDAPEPALSEEAPLSIGARRIPYSLDGSGPAALLFIHGWCGNQQFWRHQVGALETDRMLVTVDLAGSGRSSALPDPTPSKSTSIAAMAADVAEVADHLELEDVVLVGHSMGGLVALEAARILGTRCRLIVGVDTFTDARFYTRRPDAEIDRRCEEIALDYEAFVVAMIERITAPDLDPAIRRWIGREMVRVDLRHALASLRALLEWDIETFWPTVECPCETINSAALAGVETVPGLDRLQVVPIENCGHFPMIERPAEFNRLLLDILVRNGLSAG